MRTPAQKSQKRQKPKGGDVVPKLGPNTYHSRGLTIIVTVAIIDVWVAYSGPSTLDLLSLIVLLAVLGSLSVLFEGILRPVLSNSAARAAALFGVVLLGLHPSNAALLRSPGNVRLLLGLLGVALGLALYQRGFSGWLRWAYLAPVAAAAVCDRVVLSFAVLLLIYKLLLEESPSWKAVPRILAQCIPGALVSLLVLVIPGVAASASPWGPGSVIGALLSFGYPDYASQDTVSSALEMAILVALLGIAGWTSRRPATRPLALGIAWFLIMLLVAPNQFMCAYAGLALIAAWAVGEILVLVRGQRLWLLTAGCALLLAACGTATTQKNDTLKPAAATAPPAAAPPVPADSVSADAQVSPGMTPAQWVNLSVYAYQQHRYLESVAAAQTAVQLDPNNAEAYNNLAAAYSALHAWDLAITAAEQALRIKPDFTLARNNLTWAVDQRRRGAH
jgi:tetratricopeptide (TPR) repeat protein